MKDLSPAAVEEAVEEVRRRVAVPAAYDVGRNVERWVRGWEGDVDKVCAKLPATLHFRRCLRLDEVPSGSAEDFAAWARERFSPLALDYYPGGFSGLDRSGNVVLVEPLGRADPKGLLPAGRCSEFYRSRLAETEFLARKLQEEEARSGRRLGLLYVMDLEGLTTEKLGLANMHVYMDLIRMLQEHWPDLLHRILIIKAPTILHVAYRMVAPVLAKQTREKLEIVGGDWEERLHALVDPSQLPRHWGGSREGPSGSPYANVRMGGDVPAAFRYRAEDNAFEPRRLGQPLTKVSVPRASSKAVDLVIDRPSRLSWFFRVPHGDVYFSIRTKEPAQLVLPPMRLNTEQVPEWGSLECGAVRLELVFDNAHSTFKAKALEYCLRLDALPEGSAAAPRLTLEPQPPPKGYPANHSPPSHHSSQD